MKSIRIGFNRKLKLLIIGTPFLLFSSCGDLELEMQDTRSIVLKMNFDQRSSSRSSQISQAALSNHKTHLILAVPAWVNLSRNYINFYSNFFAVELMNPYENKVSLDIPLNTQIKIFAFIFLDEYSPDRLVTGVDGIAYYGESQPFYIDTNTSNLRLGINLQSASTPEGQDEEENSNESLDQESNDSSSPRVLFSPSNGEVGVEINDNITITFSEAVRNIDNTILTNSNVDNHITLKLNSATGINISFDAVINTEKTSITINPNSDLFYSQTVYVAIGATLEDYSDNRIRTANTMFYTVVDPSLEAYYPFNGNANDESGNSYHGQLGDNVTTSKFPTKTTDRYGDIDKAFYFDGNDYIALNKYVTYNSISEITVCAWVLSTNTTNNKFIISFDRSESFRLALNDDVNTNVGWDTTDSRRNSPDDLGSSDSYEDGNWHHICGWYKSSTTSDDKKIFVDGAKVAPLSSSNSHSGRNLGTNFRTKNYGFIGWGSEASSFDGNGNVHASHFMIGKIDDVRIYSRALSDSEIYALYLREKP